MCHIRYFNYVQHCRVYYAFNALTWKIISKKKLSATFSSTWPMIIPLLIFLASANLVLWSAVTLLVSNGCDESTPNVSSKGKFKSGQLIFFSYFYRSICRRKDLNWGIKLISSQRKKKSTHKDIWSYDYEGIWKY